MGNGLLTVCELDGAAGGGGFCLVPQSMDDTSLLDSPRLYILRRGCAEVWVDGVG